jgi:hypothetical protein
MFLLYVNNALSMKNVSFVFYFCPAINCDQRFSTIPYTVLWHKIFVTLVLQKHLKWTLFVQHSTFFKCTNNLPSINHCMTKRLHQRAVQVWWHNAWLTHLAIVMLYLPVLGAHISKMLCNFEWKTLIGSICLYTPKDWRILVKHVRLWAVFVTRFIFLYYDNVVMLDLWMLQSFLYVVHFIHSQSYEVLY